MTWVTFTAYLLIGYAVYYTFNILFDLLKKPSTPAGAVETLTVSDEVETIEVDDEEEEDVTITENNHGDEKENLTTNLKKEVKETTEEEQEQIIPSTVEAEISKTGGVTLTNLSKLYREESIRESNKLPFAS